MVQYSPTIACQNCGARNVLSVRGTRKGFVQGEGILACECANCHQRTSCKASEAGYVKVG